MKIYQQFSLEQSFHKILFNAYDIEKIEKITPEMISRIYIPECADNDTYNSICHKSNDNPISCVNCDTPHFQELLIDGWYVGNRNGFLDDNSYIATLQTGIRVPVDKKIYNEWEKGFTPEPFTMDDTVYNIIAE